MILRLLSDQLRNTPFKINPCQRLSSIPFLSGFLGLYFHYLQHINGAAQAIETAYKLSPVGNRYALSRGVDPHKATNQWAGPLHHLECFQCLESYPF